MASGPTLLDTCALDIRTLLRDWQKCVAPHRTDWRTYCVAGIWRRYEGEDGHSLVDMSMLTVNSDGHAVMGRMHKPVDEKRSVVILRPADYDEWLHTKNVEIARAMLQLYSADKMIAVPKYLQLT